VHTLALTGFFRLGFDLAEGRFGLNHADSATAQA
jgi:hypothetical protein